MLAFDSNILIYAADSRERDKHLAAARLLGDALRSGKALLPAQVLGEFCWARTRKHKLDPAGTLGFVNVWRAAARVESYDDTDILTAIEASRTHRIPFWDALVWAVCERTGVPVLVSEDFQNGRRLGRVTFLDPFDPANAARLGLDGA